MATKKRRCNHEARKQAITARHEAVLFLIAKGYSFKAAGYAVGRTGEFARQRYAKAARLVTKNITSKHTA